MTGRLRFEESWPIQGDLTALYTAHTLATLASQLEHAFRNCCSNFLSYTGQQSLEVNIYLTSLELQPVRTCSPEHLTGEVWVQLREEEVQDSLTAFLVDVLKHVFHKSHLVLFITQGGLQTKQVHVAEPNFSHI